MQTLKIAIFKDLSLQKLLASKGKDFNNFYYSKYWYNRIHEFKNLYEKNPSNTIAILSLMFWKGLKVKEFFILSYSGHIFSFYHLIRNYWQ